MPQFDLNTKRPRSDTFFDDNQAECPFTVRVLDPRDKELRTKSKKRRKRRYASSDTGDFSGDEDGNHKILLQCAPFEPRGSFVTHSDMDVHYVVEPADLWASLTRYNSFVLNGLKFFCEGFIAVANDASLELQKSGMPAGLGHATAAAGGTQGDGGPRKRTQDDWVARVLEIRASDEHHVYARVFWMYWPDELPPGTHYGKRMVQGRQPYHGASELIASNHMDVINVVSVTSMSSVNHLNEDKDDDVQNALYWRQALDVRTMELSSVEGICVCNQPANPDKMLIGCSNDSCAKWIHEECLKHYALMRVYERLGHSKPHVKTKSHLRDLALTVAIKPEIGEDHIREPLSPQDSEGAASARHSMDAKADTVDFQEASEYDESESNHTNAKYRSRRNNGHIERYKKRNAAGGTVQLKREVTPSESEAGADFQLKGAIGLATPMPTNATSGTASVSDKSRKSIAARGLVNQTSAGRAFSTLQSYGNKKKPYDKLFEAELLLTPLDSSAPTMIEIRDLRRKAAGGEKVWMEPAECPVCGSAIR